MNTKTNDMSPTEIRIAILQANITRPGNITQSGMALDLGVTRQTVNRVIDGLITSDRVRRHIAKAIDVDIKRIWPSTYLYGGGPRKAGRPRGSGIKSACVG